MSRYYFGLTLAVAVVMVVGWTVFSQNVLQLGYGIVEVDGQAAAPAATALFSFRNNGVLTWEAAVPAVEPIARGRIFVDRSVGARTAVALTNPSDERVDVELTLRDSLGSEIASVMRTIDPRQHQALFVDELFPAEILPETGSLSFETASPEQRLAAITLRQGSNKFTEPIFTTLPVVDLDRIPEEAVLVFPHIGAGETLSTQFILVNPTSERLSGQIRFTDSNGEQLLAVVNELVVSEAGYEIEPNGVFFAEMTDAGMLQTGYAVVTLEEGPRLPEGTAVFQFLDQGALDSEAGVGAVLPTTRALMFVDNAAHNGARTRTGLAAASPGNPEGRLRFRLLDRFGLELDAAEEPTPANGHVARFADEIFPSIPEGFTGYLEVAADFLIYPISLKLTVNQRGDPILATLPVADMTRPIQARRLVIPRLGSGDGFESRLILISTDPEAPSSGRLLFRTIGGEDLELQLGDRFGSEFDFEIPAGGGSTFHPGSTLPVQHIHLDTLDPEAREVVVDEGRMIQLRPRVVDAEWNSRDDFKVNFALTDTLVAAVDASGMLRGLNKGFATLLMRTGGVEEQATVSVVRVSSGAGVGDVISVVQDLSGRIYLANSAGHVILRADNVSGLPRVYAGERDIPGFVNGRRLEARFRRPTYMAIDQQSGDIFLSDSGNNVIRRLLANQNVQTYAGGPPGSADGPRLSARFNNPQGLALDSKGRLWIVDSGNHTIRLLDSETGEVTTLAGRAGQAGFADGFGQDARFNNPIGIAIETETYIESISPIKRELVSVFVADSGNGLIRRVVENGRVETVSMSSELPGAENSSLQADRFLRFEAPTDVAFDVFGNLFVSEPDTGRVRVIVFDSTPECLPTCLPMAIAVVSAFEADRQFVARGMTVVPGGRLLTATFSMAEEKTSLRAIDFGLPEITSVDSQQAPLRIRKRLRQGGVPQRVLVEGHNFTKEGTAAVIGDEVIRNVSVNDSRSLSFDLPELRSGKTTLTIKGRAGLAQAALVIEPVALGDLPAGFVTTVAGGANFEGDGAPAVEASLASPNATALDSLGNLYIADSSNHRIRKVDSQTRTIITIAGSGLEGDSGDGEAALAARLSFPQGLAVDRFGNIFIADTSNNKIRRVDVKTGLITTFAGSGEDATSGDGGPAIEASIDFPRDLAVDAHGNLYIVTQNRVRRIDAASGIIVTVAGAEQSGFSGDGGPAAGALLNGPRGVAVDAAGNIYIADFRNDRIRRVDGPSGMINTIAGNGNRGFSGDGGPAIEASLDLPSGVVVDGTGAVFTADLGSQRIRRVDPQTQVISTVAGNGSIGFSGDGEPAVEAELNFPVNISLDGSGNLYISDSLNLRIRKVDAATGVIATVAGDGRAGQSEGFSGDGEHAFAATLFAPEGLAFDLDGNLYIADSSNHRIRRVDTQGIIDTIAGNGSAGLSGDGGPALSASLNVPNDVVADRAGDLYIADLGNHSIRRVDLATGLISTAAGTGQQGFSGDGGAAGEARLRAPFAVAVDGGGNLYIADTDNNRIRRVDALTGMIQTIAGTGQEGFSGDGGPAEMAALARPSGIAVDPSVPALFVADRGNNRVRRIDLESGIITTFAGQGGFGFSGDGGPATQATIERPFDVALDAQGNLYVVSPSTQTPETGLRDGRVRRIDAATGIITTVAGSGNPLVVLDGVMATESAFQLPMGLAVDGEGNLFISELQSNRVRAVRGPL